MKLYEITRELEEFQAMVENGEIPAEAVADTLAGIEFEFDEKVENIACLIKNLAADVDAIEAEAAALTARAKQKKSAIDFYKRYLTEAFGAANREKFESARCAITFRASEKVIIPDIESFYKNHKDFCKEKVEITPDKTLVKKLLKGGMEIDGAQLEKSQNIQIK